MIGILVDDVSSVTACTKEDIDSDVYSSDENHHDSHWFIWKQRKSEMGKRLGKLNALGMKRNPWGDDQEGNKNFFTGTSVASMNKGIHW